jgi:RHS repeat-associated protein
MFQMSTTAMGMRQTKHIYVGDTRIATKNNWWKDAGTDYEKYNTYWYHGDHLGSAQLVSDWHGDEYERIEYTPYGETWIEKIKSGFECINYRFTGKEQDSETGLYYYGARYLDPKYSRWLSCDPALGEYIPGAGSDTSKLPGMGGVYNTVNLNLYHYAGNNPVKYTDPDGLSTTRWLKRNANNMLSLAADGVEIGTGIVGLGTSFGLSSLMIVHGSANAITTVTKIAVTTYIANVQGDDAADLAENNLPSSAIGMLSYGLAKMVDSIVEGPDCDKWVQAMGSVGDMLDFAIGIGLSAGFEKSVTEALQGMDAKQLSQFEKVLKTAKDNKSVQISENAYNVISGIVQDIKTTDSLMEAY